MPPRASTPVDHRDVSRQRHAGGAASAGAVNPREAQRSASFHGRGAAEQQHHQRHGLLKQRPRTQPDLLAGIRGRNFRLAGDGAGAGAVPAAGRKAAPSRALVTVGVRQSMWPLHVMACTEWRVADLVAAAVELYVREGRRPLLPSGDPSDFGLHYSQFSLQSLDPEEKLMELGSRSFFLCPKAAAAAAAGAGASSACSSGETGGARATSADKAEAFVPWLEFMQYWPLL